VLATEGMNDAKPLLVYLVLSLIACNATFFECGAALSQKQTHFQDGVQVLYSTVALLHYLMVLHTDDHWKAREKP